MDLFPPDIHQFVQIAWGISAFFCLVAIVLELLGGIYALRRQKWVLTLIGSIVAFLAFFPIGIPAIIFTVTSKNEFES
jgi:magnesium-transporting ATPase (P-type)